MIRLHLVVEGQTEKEFVKRVLAPHLGQYQVFADARCVMTSKKGAYWHRGGLLNYAHAETDLRLWMKEDQNADAWFSTMFDLYALPTNFPDFEQIGGGRDPYDRVERLENAFASRLGHRRFIPYIQLHEFEALIFVDVQRLSTEFMERKVDISTLVQIVQDAGNPEIIDDGSETAPSKRIISKVPEYASRKPSAGPLVVEKIGLGALRQKCVHFAKWISRLEGLPNANT